MPRRKKAAWEDPQFSPEDMQYDPDEFRVPASDNRGQSVREWVRLMPQMESAMDIIIAQRKFPYELRSQIIRHAIGRHLAWLHRLEPSMPKTYLGAMQGIIALLQEEEHKLVTEDVFRRLYAKIEEYIQAGNIGQVVKLVGATKRALDNVPTNMPWRDACLERFRRQYGHYLLPGAVAAGTGVVVDALPEGARRPPVAPDAETDHDFREDD
jgi:hypothetical protein